MKEFKGFDGHIILFCKGHYKCPNSYIKGLRIIWSIRCGYPYNEKDHSVDRYIANKLYSLLKELNPERISYIQERIHDDITCSWRFEKDSTPIEKLIYIYISEIANIQVKEKKGERYVWLFKLPKPMKKLFNKILSGKGSYDDYWLVEPKNS